MTNAMILCAGLGTRLRPLTNELPKPLVWIGDRPALTHIVQRLEQGGVSNVVLNTHHLAEKFDASLLASLPIPALLVHEPQIRGTAGGVAGAADKLPPGEVIVWNGDILADVDIAALRRAYAEESARGALAVLVVLPRQAIGEGFGAQGAEGDPKPQMFNQGTIGLGADGRVVRLRGQVFGEEKRSADYVGVQMIGGAVRSMLPAEGCFMADVYLPALRRGERVATASVVTRFTDLGTVDGYVDENLRWLKESGRDVYVGPNSIVPSNVELSASIVGEGAQVRGSGRLDRVVVWPGATVQAPLENAVVMRSGEVVSFTGNTSPR
jgi:mannose-1-phosphate guanylyltransferase